jgi:hypothetical protein
MECPQRVASRRFGSLAFRRAEAPHRIQLWARPRFTADRIVYDNLPAWTLVVTGPARRRWGFHSLDGWIDAEEYQRRRPDLPWARYGAAGEARS